MERQMSGVDHDVVRNQKFATGPCTPEVNLWQCSGEILDTNVELSAPVQCE